MAGAKLPLEIAIEMIERLAQCIAGAFTPKTRR